MKTIDINDFIENLKDVNGNEGDHYDLICYGSGKAQFYKGMLVTCIEQSGGGEGGSQDCHTVLKIGDEFYRIDYTYFSYCGFEYDESELYLVEPVERVVTVYEKVE